MFKKTPKGKWYGEYRDRFNRRKVVALSKDKQAAAAKLLELQRKADRQRAGLESPTDDQAKRPLQEHVDAFAQYLRSKGNTAKHVDLTIQRINAVASGCRAAFISDITAGRVQAYLRDRRAGGLSTQTSNHHLRCIKAFTRWLLRDRRATEDALLHLSIQNVAVDRRHVRRTISDDDLSRLLAVTEQGPTRRGLSGPGRAMLYTVAAYTGLRAQELASLTVGSFDLGSDTPTVVVEAGSSKHRQRDVVPLPEWLADKLRAWLSGRTGDVALWPGNWPTKAAAMLRKDLKPAGIPYTSDGLVFDFHALRAQYAVTLARAGVPLATAQKLMRHSDPKLTANVYTRLGVHDLGGAVAALPSPTSWPTDGVLRATGTDDQNGCASGCASPAKRPPANASSYNERKAEGHTAADRNPMENPTFPRENDGSERPVAPVAQRIAQRFPKPESDDHIQFPDNGLRSVPLRMVAPTVAPSEKITPPPAGDADSVDVRLTWIIEAWPTLSEQTKSKILDLLDADDAE